MAGSVVKLLSVLLVLAPGLVEAAAPQTSLPPRLRPGTSEAVTAPAPRLAPRVAGTVRAYPPRLRPGGRAVAVAATGIEAASRTGALCGRRTLRGERLRPISAGAACGIAEPVRLRSVDGVELSQPAILDCDTALAFETWVREEAVPAWGRLGRGLGRIETGESFTCTAPAPVTAAHASGQAVDVLGFTLKNGVTVTVAKGWRDPVAGQVLRKLRDGACEVFPVVLGPEAGRGQGEGLHLGQRAGSRRKACR